MYRWECMINYLENDTCNAHWECMINYYVLLWKFTRVMYQWEFMMNYFGIRILWKSSIYIAKGSTFFIQFCIAIHFYIGSILTRNFHWECMITYFGNWHMSCTIENVLWKISLEIDSCSSISKYICAGFWWRAFPRCRQMDCQLPFMWLWEWVFGRCAVCTGPRRRIGVWLIMSQFVVQETISGKVVGQYIDPLDSFWHCPILQGIHTVALFKTSAVKRSWALNYE